MTDGADSLPQTTPPDLRLEVRDWCEGWRTSIQTVIAQVSGQPAAFEISAQPLAAADSDVWYTVVAGGAVRGEMTLRLPAAAGTRLAQKFLGETAPSPEADASLLTPENKEALEELLRQIAGLASTAVGAAAGGEVKLHLAASGAPAWSSDAVVCIQTRDESGAAIPVEIQISPALAAALRPSSPPVASTVVTAPSSSTAQAASYGRLMNVGLNVKLRFGSRRMLLRDVLALCPGVVVELDNTLHSPVDLLLDGRLIAQGDVVIVDGKYGLRITGVVDPASTAGAV